jgi:arginine utilization protein RocB
VNFFAQTMTDGDRAFAERLTRKNMKSLPYWQSHPFDGFPGPEATDGEFSAAMAKLMG